MLLCLTPFKIVEHCNGKCHSNLTDDVVELLRLPRRQLLDKVLIKTLGVLASLGDFFNLNHTIVKNFA